jgi:NAD(P)H-dependent flavin oxidoreductase YrpB (nitropropane dioxygenase family)
MEPVNRRRILQLLGCGGAALLARPALAGGGPPGAQRLSTRLTREYGLQHPIVGAGMGFYALPELVAAISNAGALGVLGGAVVPPPFLQQQIQQIKGLTSNLYGVDLVNDTTAGFVTDAHIDVLVEEAVPIVVFFWDPPTQAWVDTLHAAGAKVWMQVGTVTGALAAAAVGVDLFIAQGGEAGGHQRGVFEGVVTPRAQLVPLVAAAVAPSIVLAAGGIADGRGLADSLEEGAEGAWVGTRFATSQESYAHDQYKQRVLAAYGPGDAVVTTMFGPEWPDKPLRVLRDLVVDQWAGREDQIPNPPPPPAVIGNTLFAGEPYAMPKFSVILPTRDTTGDFDQMAWTAGIVSALLIDDVPPAAQIVSDMVQDAYGILQQEAGGQDCDGGGGE